MRRLRAGDVLPPGVSAGLVDLLRLNTDLSMVAAAFALDPLAHVGADLGVRLFNKTGTQDGTRADIGCVVVERAGRDVRRPRPLRRFVQPPVGGARRHA